MKRNPTICIIDDEPAHRLISRRITERTVPEALITEAASTKEVLSLLETAPPFILFILDLNIKGHRSIDCIPNLLKHSPDALIILVSTSILEEDILSCYAAGVHCYIFKGDSPHEYQHDLAQSVRFLLR